MHKNCFACKKAAGHLRLTLAANVLMDVQDTLLQETGRRFERAKVLLQDTETRLVRATVAYSCALVASVNTERRELQYRSTCA